MGTKPTIPAFFSTNIMIAEAAAVDLTLALEQVKLLLQLFKSL
jgi:hypothetical protein